MALAVAILTIRHFERRAAPSGVRYLPLLAAAGLSILITIADYQQANCARAAAQMYRKRYGVELGKVWFQGHWGFQYYIEQWGAKAFDRKKPQVARGEIIVGRFGDPSVAQISPEKVLLQDQSTFSVLPFVTTFALGTGAGFYSSLFGPLPCARAVLYRNRALITAAATSNSGSSTRLSTNTPRDRHRAFCNLKQNPFEIDRSFPFQPQHVRAPSDRDRNANCAG